MGPILMESKHKSSTEQYTQTVGVSPSHLLFWFMYVPQHKVQKGRVKLNMRNKEGNYNKHYLNTKHQQVSIVIVSMAAY